MEPSAEREDASDAVPASGTAARGRRAQRDSTRDALVNAGAKAFAERRLDGVRISRVAQAAGVANGTFYLYFKNKDELFRAVVNRLMGDLARRVTEVHERYEANAPDDGDRAEITAFIDFVEEFPGIISAVWADGPNGDAMNILAEQRAVELHRMRAEGIVRNDIDLRVTARAEAYLVLATLGWWDQTRDVDRETLITTLSGFRRRGTRPPHLGR